MHDILSNATFFGVMVSILSYELGLFIKKKTQSPICNPLLISIIVTIGVLLLLHIDYKSYNAGAQYLSYLLTPATVCLAIPLYEQLSLLVRNVKAILIGIIAGVLASVGSSSACVCCSDWDMNITSPCYPSPSPPPSVWVCRKSSAAL